MTIEAGLILSVLVAVVGCTKWISGALASLGAKMDGVHEKQTETNKRVDKLEVVAAAHGERLATLEVPRR